MDLLFHDRVLLLSNAETYEMIFVGVLGFEVLNLARAGGFNNWCKMVFILLFVVDAYFRVFQSCFPRGMF